MSFQAMAWAIAQRPGGPGPKSVLMALANYADESGSCYPSRERLADECEISVRSVSEYLMRLRDMGLIWWENQTRANGSSTSNRYYLNTANGYMRQSEPVDKRRTDYKTPGESGVQDLHPTKTDNRDLLGASGVQILQGGGAGSAPPRGTNHLEPENRGVARARESAPARGWPQCPPEEIHDPKPAVRPAPTMRAAQRPAAPSRQRPEIGHDGLPVVVPPRCWRHIDDESDHPCRACGDARAAHELSRRARADAIVRQAHADRLAADAAVAREAAAARAAGRRGRGSLRSLVAEHRAHSTDDGPSGPR